MRSPDSGARWARALLPLVAALGLWALVAQQAWVSPVILPPPTRVALALGVLWREDLYVDVARTALRVVLAVGAALVAGVPAGLYLGHQRRLYGYLEPMIHALRSVPVTALFPLLVLAVGVSEFAIVSIAAYPSALLMLVHCASGAALANARRVQQATALGMTGLSLARNVLFYEALPSLLQGLRSATAQSLVLVVAIELFFGFGQRGLGRKIFDFQSTYRTPEAIAAILVTGATGIGFNVVLTRLARRALMWHPSGRDVVV